ncbi:MAG: UDP-N-acetylglucosamine--N-acetylmuramyl-(pentapeptide) pyrophosphoryl-undecaprenol N-acetylglucosamine transferase [Christensenellales bacterium]
MNIALTGGGTAGHIMPNLALVPYLRRNFDKIIYIGNSSCMEGKICPQYGIEFFHNDSIKFDRSKLLKNLAIPFILPKCVRKACATLSENHIDVVFSKGGYVALPVTLAAKKLGIPVVCHESDTSLGLANKIASRFAKAVITSHTGVYRKDNGYMLGNPIRDKIFDGNPNNVYAAHSIVHGKPILLVVGGSLGARAINQAVVSALDELTERYNVVHITGKNFLPPERKGYYTLPYTDDIQDYLAAADVVVSRAGANFVDEILALGKKALFIPLPAKASRGDQLTNASRVCSLGYANMLQQQYLTPATLTENIERTYAADFKKCYYDRSTPQKIATLLNNICRQSQIDKKQRDKKQAVQSASITFATRQSDKK